MPTLSFSLTLRRFANKQGFLLGGIESLSRSAARFGIALGYAETSGVLFVSYRCVAFGPPRSLLRFRRFLLSLRDSL